MGQALPFATEGKVEIVSTAATATATATGDAASKTVVTPKSLAGGGTISTAKDGSASVTLGDLGSVRLDGDTKIEIPAAADAGHSLELLKGKLHLQINSEELQKRQAGEFRLKTPAALLAVKGTKFFVSSDAKGDTVGLHEGSVAVQGTADAAPVILSPGEAVETSGGKAEPVRPMTAAEKRDVAAYAESGTVFTSLGIVQGYFKDSGRPAPVFFEGKYAEAMPASTAVPFLKGIEWVNFRSSGDAYSTRGKERMYVPGSHFEESSAAKPDGTLEYALKYRYGPRYKSPKEEREVKLEDFMINISGTLNVQGRAWRMKHAGQSMGELIGIYLRVGVKNVARLDAYSSSVAERQSFAPPVPTAAASGWEQSFVIPVTLRRSGSHDGVYFSLYYYPDGPYDAQGALREGVAEVRILECRMISEAKLGVGT